MVSRAHLPFVVALLGLAMYIAGPVGRLAVAGIIVLFVPGYLVWSILGSDLRLPRLAAPAVWLTLSLSIVPMAFLWASTLGLRLTPLVLQLQAVGISLLALWTWHRQALRVTAPAWLALILVVILSLVGLTRWLQIRDVALPLWVDSVHHTLLVRVIGETGQIPTSLQPYLPVEQLKYHWGYHTVVAAWRGISRLPLSQAVLWNGQVLNALSALVMYAFAAAVLRSPRAGLLAAGIVGLLSLMPAYYVTWGRYTQLTGLLLLPMLIVTSMALAEHHKFSWRLLMITALLLAGLMLVHYRVLVFYAAFMLPYGLLLLVRWPVLFARSILRLVLVVVLAVMLISPWAMLMIESALVPVVQSPTRLIGSTSYNSFEWTLLLAGNNRQLMVLAGLGGLIGVFLQRWRVIVIVLWVGTMLLIANPTVIGVPASWFINNHSVIITLFLPISLLGAYCIHQVIALLRYMPRTMRPVSGAIVAVLLAMVAVYGTWQLRTVVNPLTDLVTVGDTKAIEWIDAHTTPNARFLVNSTHWLNSSPRGTDAGWWLLPLTGRWVTTPPALYIYGKPEYKQAVEALNQRIGALKPDDLEQLKQIIREERITHIYIGGKNAGPLRSDILLSDSTFAPVYNTDGVTIFEVRQGS